MSPIIKLYQTLVNHDMPIEFIQFTGIPVLHCSNLTCRDCPYVRYSGITIGQGHCSDLREADYPDLHNYLLTNNPEHLI